MKCRHCQASNPDAGRFCAACGSALEASCATCGTANPLDARFCGQCGAALRAAEHAMRSAPASAPANDSSFAEEGERKHVTVLFADIRGSTELIESLDPEAAMGQLDPTIKVMAAAVKRFGGTVNSVRGDGIMALFGAPNACEDHAVMACLAAASMIEDAARLNDPQIQIRVGIDSGNVVIRSTGSDATDYDATGVVAHLANRVEQQAAPGTVFLTGRTARLARGHVQLNSVGRVPIKGLSTPLELFQLVKATARPSWEVRSSAHPLNSFVGRQAELPQLHAALDRAGRGFGQVVTLVADGGFGKSRLVHEFLRELPSGSWNVLRVAAVSHTLSAPYHSAAELLRAVLAVDGADGPAEVARKLAHTLALIDPEKRADLAPLQSLLELPVQEQAWPGLAPPLRRSRTISALRSLVLREAALHPLVLVVEDYQWVDLPSAELLDAVVEGMGAARLLVLMTTRPDRFPPWSRRSYCLQLQLPALEPDSAEMLLRELIGPSPDLGHLRQQILVQAGGVPLFIEEIARSLIESGVLAGRGAATASYGLALDVVIPASLHGIIASRIDRLPPVRRKLLHTASVIGKDVPLALLEAVADLPQAVLAREIAELQDAEFLYELDLPSGKEYTFRHALIQTVAYEEMLRKTRRELHARVMRATEILLANRLDELTERLSDHAMRGEEWQAAFSYSLKAGDRATGRWAWREAIVFYDRAIEALAHLPEDAKSIRAAIDARLRLRIALPGVGDLPRIARCLEEARTLALGVGDPALQAEIDTSRCLTLTKMGLLGPAIDAGRQGLERARGLHEKAALLNASFALAQAYWYGGEFALAADLLSERLDDVRGELRLRNTGTTGTVSVLSLVCLSKTFAITGQSAKALECVAEARQIAEEAGKPFDLSYAGVGRGFCLLLNDDPAGAALVLEESLHIARAADIALLIPSSQRYLGWAYASTGRLHEAQQVLEDAIARTGSAGLLGMRLWSLAGLAQVQADLAPQEAGRTLEAALELAARHGFRPLQARLMRLLGKLQAGNGATQSQAAEASLRQAIALADALGMAPEATHARRDLQALAQRPSARTPG